MSDDDMFDPEKAEIEAFIEDIKSGNIKGFETKLELNSELARARDAAGLSVLLLAAYHHQPEMVEALVSGAGPLDLFEAAATGRSERVIMLLGEERTRIHHFSPDGFQALHLAAFFGHEALVGLLIELGAHIHTQSRNELKLHPINCAAAAGAAEAVKSLLEAGADPNAAQTGNITVLMSAAAGGNRDMVKDLIEAGAEVAQQSKDGKTASVYAEEHDHLALSVWLKEQK